MTDPLSVRLPYGKDAVVLHLPPERLAGLLVPPGLGGAVPASEEPASMVHKALVQPIGSPRLRDLAHGKHNIVVLTPDHTRPMPSRLTLPPLLAEIREGAPDAEITLLVATGVHRSTRDTELEERFGGILSDYHARLAVHDCDQTEGLTSLAGLASTTPVRINRIAAEADLLVAEGLIEPHFFAGYSGGRKSVLPGVAARESVMANHRAALIAHPRARTGMLDGNPIHDEMVRAAEAAGLAFILNVVIDPDHRLAAAFAGDPDKAHRAGCDWLAGRAGVAPIPADIVVTTNGGYPLDRDLYQAVKSMTAAEACCRPGGVIIEVSRCQDGVGSDGMFHTFAKGDPDVTSQPGTRPDPGAVLAAIEARSADGTLPDQWQSQILARVLSEYTVIVVSDLPDAVVEAMGFVAAPDPDAALVIADRLVGSDARIVVIPDGVGVVVR